MIERVRPTRSWASLPLAVLLASVVSLPTLLARPQAPATAAADPAARPSQTPQPPTAAQEGFVPVENLPQQESIPAPRLVAAAYACVWIVLMSYLYSIWRRLGTVQRELETVSRRLPDASRRS